MLLHNEGVNIQKSGQEITPGEIQEILESIEGMPNEAQIKPTDLAYHETGKIYYGMQRTFRTCSEVLLPLYFSIRRYPDLQIHRIIHDRLRGRLGAGRTYRALQGDPWMKWRVSPVCERRAAKRKENPIS